MTAHLAEPPWWGSGVFLVIGALIAFAATWLTKQRELTRLDRARWDNQILEGTILIVETIDAVSSDLIAHQDAASVERFLDREPTIREVQAVCKKFRLITSPRMAEIAKQLSVLFDMALRDAHEADDSSPGKLRSRMSDARNKAAELHDNARIELRGTKETERRARRRLREHYDTYNHPFDK